MLRGLIRTLKQISSVITLSKQRYFIFEELKSVCRNKSILICGAGPHLNIKFNCQEL